MGFHHAQRLEQRIELMLKQELRLELRQMLKQLLRLVQELKLSQLTFASLIQFAETVRQIPREDLRSFAHEMVRQGGFAPALELRKALNAAHLIDPMRFQGMDEFVDSLARVIRKESDRRHDADAGRFQPALALQLVLRAPEFFGGTPGTPANLALLLNAIPQTEDGYLHWILAGGWAVEMLTGVTREHHDIDSLVMTKKPLYLDTDVVHSTNYFGVLSCSRQFVFSRCLAQVEWVHNGTTFEVIVLKPEFLFCSKLHFGARARDWDDAIALAKRFSHEWDVELIRELFKRSQAPLGKQRTNQLTTLLQTANTELILASIDELRSSRAM